MNGHIKFQEMKVLARIKDYMDCLPKKPLGSGFILITSTEVEDSRSVDLTIQLFILSQAPLTCYNAAAVLVLRWHSPLPAAYKQLAAYVLTCSCSFCPASQSFEIMSPENIVSVESENLVDCSRMNSTYLRSTGTFVGHTKKALWH
jgi:hypothetical protein